MKPARRVCPKCGSEDIHRSRSRGITEKLRKLFSSSRLFRCHKCGWRGWLSVNGLTVAAIGHLGPGLLSASIRKKHAYQYLLAGCLGLAVSLFVLYAFRYCG